MIRPAWQPLPIHLFLQYLKKKTEKETRRPAVTRSVIRLAPRITPAPHLSKSSLEAGHSAAWLQPRALIDPNLTRGEMPAKQPRSGLVPDLAKLPELDPIRSVSVRVIRTSPST